MAGVDVERQRGVCVEVVARTIVSNPRCRIPSAPVGGVRRRIKHTRDPDRATSALVCVAFPGSSTRLIGRLHRVGSPDSPAGLGSERTHRTSYATISTRVTYEGLASARQLRPGRVAARLMVIVLD